MHILEPEGTMAEIPYKDIKNIPFQKNLYIYVWCVRLSMLICFSGSEKLLFNKYCIL